MQPVIQQEQTGCGIASAAVIAGLSYQQAKQVANDLGIFAEDKSLGSSTDYVRSLLDQLGYKTSAGETEFVDWQSLPACALLATKWHIEDGKPFWHWAVFSRDENGEQVFDSNASLPSPIRKDFDQIKPKWFIGITKK
jgi:ABC-type bacteriocin/lantibiotic exporter with double-glycine peptidase domain